MKKAIFVVGILGFTNIAFAQGPTTDLSYDNSPDQAQTSDQNAKSSNQPPSTVKEAETAPSPKPDYAGLLLPIGRIGPTVSLTGPQIYNVALDVRLWNTVGISFEYGPGFDLKASGASLKTSYWSLNGQWFPWAGTFFVGGKFGAQNIEATLDSTTELQGQKLDLTMTATLDSTYITPYLGWHAMWGGFLFGSDFGVMIPLSAKAKLDAKVKDVNAAEREAAEDTEDYKKAKDDAEKAAEKLGKTILPYATLIKIGYLF